MPERQPKFDVGTRFKTRGKKPRHCTIVDIYRTYNVAGELVRLEYVATHTFAGQSISERVSETTVAMGL